MAVSQTSTEPMFINGEWTEGTSGKRIPVYDPSTEEVIAEIPDAGAADSDDLARRNRLVHEARSVHHRGDGGQRNRYRQRHVDGGAASGRLATSLRLPRDS